MLLELIWYLFYQKFIDIQIIDCSAEKSVVQYISNCPTQHSCAVEIFQL